MTGKSFHRTDRVSAQLRRDLGQIVHHAVREHGLPSMSVSDVEISRDMSHAKVHFTVLNPEKIAEAREGLTRAGLTIKDIDVVEINEAFAAQALAFDQVREQRHDLFAGDRVDLDG